MFSSSGGAQLVVPNFTSNMEQEIGEEGMKWLVDGMHVTDILTEVLRYVADAANQWDGEAVGWRSHP